MYEFVVRRVETVLDGTFVKRIDFEYHELVRSPAFLLVFLDFVQRRSLLLRQIAEEREHDAVPLLDRVTVDFRTSGRLVVLTDGRNSRAAAVSGEAPAVIGTDHVVVPDPAFAQRATSMDTNIAQDVSFAFVVAERDQSEPENLCTVRLVVGNFF